MKVNLRMMEVPWSKMSQNAMKKRFYVVYYFSLACAVLIFLIKTSPFLSKSYCILRRSANKSGMTPDCQASVSFAYIAASVKTTILRHPLLCAFFYGPAGQIVRITTPAHGVINATG